MNIFGTQKVLVLMPDIVRDIVVDVTLAQCAVCSALERRTERNVPFKHKDTE